MNLEEATKLALQGKLLNEDINNQTDFEAFITEYKKKYNLYKSDNYKWQNNKLYNKTQTGWNIVDYVKWMRNIGPYKIGSVHFNCALPYSNYYIVDTNTSNVYKIDNVIFTSGYNGVLKEIVNDLQLVTDNNYINTKKDEQEKLKNQFDPLEGLI